MPSGEASDNFTLSFLKSKAPLSILNLEAISRELKFENNGTVVVGAPSDLSHLSRKEVDHSTLQFQQMMTTLRSEQESSEGRATAFSDAMDVIGDVSDSSAVGTFAKIAITDFAEDFNKEIAGEYRQTGLEAAKVFFDSRKFDPVRLKEYAQRGVDAYVQEIHRQSGLSDDLFATLSPDERTIGLKKITDFAIAADGITRAELVRNSSADEKRFADLSSKFAKLGNANQTLLTGIADLTRQAAGNAEQLNTLTLELRRTTADVSIIQKMLFNHVSVNEQVSMLQHSGALGLTDQQRQTMLSNLKQRAELEEATQEWSKFIYGGQTVTRILDRFGASKELTAALSSGLANFSIMQSAVTALASGNYLGAINGVLGLGLSALESPEAQRQQQIITMLSAIIDNQKKILDALNTLSTQIDTYHRDVVSRLELIYQLDTETLMALQGVLHQGLNACDNFITRLPREPASYTYLSQRFDESQFNLLQQCTNHLLTFTPSEDNISAFGLPAVDASNLAALPSKAMVQPYKLTLLPLFSFLDNFMGDQSYIVGALYLPGLLYTDIWRKVQLIRTQSKSLLDPRPATPPIKDQRNFYTSLMTFRSFVDLGTLTRYVNVELAINRYREIVDLETHRLKTLDLLAKLNSTGNDAEIALWHALDWVNLATAQQKLLAGDVMIPFLNDVALQSFDHTKGSLTFVGQPLLPSQKNADQPVALAQHVLGHNRILLENLLRFRLYEALKKKQINPAAYAWAYERTTDSSYMNFFTDGEIQYEWRADAKDADEKVLPPGWYTKYKYFDADPDIAKDVLIDLIPAPTAEDFRNGAFVPTYALSRLVELRRRLLGRLLDFDISERAAKESRLPQLKLLVAYANRH